MKFVSHGIFERRKNGAKTEKKFANFFARATWIAFCVRVLFADRRFIIVLGSKGHSVFFRVQGVLNDR